MRLRSTSTNSVCILCCYRGLLLLLLGCCCGTRQRLAPVAQAKLQAALILPHGDAAFDPRTVPASNAAGREAARQIARAAREAAAWFVSESQEQQHSHAAMDVVFLVSPHGVALSRDFGVLVGNAAAGGSAEIGADNHHHRDDPNDDHPSSAYTVTLPSVPLAPALSQRLVERLNAQQQNVTGIQFPENPGTVPLVLSWAEVIPLLLLGTAAAAAATNTTPSLDDPKKQQPQQQQRQHLIWTQPLRRFDHAAAMIPELLRLGQILGDWMESLPRTRFGVLVSGDLSHTHRPDGPYGYSAAAARMDQALGAWAGDPCGSRGEHALLASAAALQDRALSCGFTGFVLLHGALCRPKQQQQWKSDVLVNRNATYFGMMVANFSRTPSSSSDAIEKNPTETFNAATAERQETF